jgi:xanthine dehydrogenase molybdopterin-binding subunit B
LQVLLTASARGGLHDEQTDAAAAMYQSFGVGAAEVEVDCVTGERRLLRADIMFDAGKSVSPAIDMGQVSANPLGQPIPSLPTPFVSLRRV